MNKLKTILIAVTLIFTVIFITACGSSDIAEESTVEVVSENITEKEIIITEYSNYEKSETEDILWDLCVKYAPNKFAAAGAMGMFYRESRYKSDALCGWAHIVYENPTICEDFTTEIDSGLSDGSSYEFFVDNVHWKYGGFGLVTWGSISYLESLYSFARDWGTSIADAEMQVAFLFWDVQNNNPELWDELINAKTAEHAGNKFGMMYDRTSEWDSVGSFARDIYNRHEIDNT